MNENSARYHLSEQDFVRAGAVHARPAARVWLSLGVVLVLCLALAIWGPTRAWRFGGMSGVVGGGVCLLLQFVVSPWLARRQYRRYPAARGEQTVTLTDEGVRLEGQGGVSDLRWDLVYQWRSNGEFVLIYPAPRLYHLVPCRVAGQGFDVAALEAALTRHVGPAR